MKKHRITSKFRFTVFLTIVLVSAVFIAGTILGLNNVSSLSTDDYIKVQIQSGDTLWHIASEYGPNHIDRRRIVYEICKVNHITAKDIQPGQFILIPQEM